MVLIFFITRNVGMKHITRVACCLGVAILFSSCSNQASFSNRFKSTLTNQRYVNLSVPLGAGSVPLHSIYVLDSNYNQVAYWTTVANSLPKIAPPYPYLNLPLTSGTSTVFYIVVPQGGGNYNGCSLTFDQNGNYINETAPGASACQGVVQTQNENYNHKTVSSHVTVFSLGTNFGSSFSVPSTTTLTAQVAAQAIPREITFVNNTNYDLCLVNQIKGNNNAAPTISQMCGSGNPGGSYQTLVPSQQSVHFPIPVSGLNSAGWIIAGYRTPVTGNPNQGWMQTGFAGSSRQQAATKVELTMFPYYPSGTHSGPIYNSVGPTNIDISSVDGANLTYKFYPEQPVSGATRVCTLANNNVAPTTQYTGVFSSASPISYFGNANGNGQFSCNSGNIYTDGNGNNVGCASPCSMAYVNNAPQSEINGKCCIGNDATMASCVSSSNSYNPQNSWYTSMINAQYINSYSFAFDDAKADFTCDAFASFVFEIDGVGSGIL